MSAGVVRSSGATCTITSYCSPSRLKRVTWRPPSIVSSVRPTVSTGTPMSDSLSRLMRTRTSGVLSRRSVCRFCTPGILARLVEEAVDEPLQLGVGNLRHDDELDRRRAERLAERRRIDRERDRAGNRRELRPQLVGDLLLLLRRAPPTASAAAPRCRRRRSESRRSPCTPRLRESARRTPRSA